MAISIITGGSGSGKSHYLNESVIREAMENPQNNYIVVVPEQYTMQTQKALVAIHPNHGLINIDIVSFKRLAFRIFGELGTNVLEILDDTGKNLILRKVIDENKDKMLVYKNKVRMQGFIEKVKSSISELHQYNVDKVKMEELLAKTTSKSMLNGKIKDMALIYDEFNRYIKDKFITKEEILKVLIRVVHNSGIIADSKLYFDGFTGFTPVQYDLLKEINKYAKEMVFTVNIDKAAMNNMTEYGFSQVKEHDLFKMSKDTINELVEVAMANNEKIRIIKSFDEAIPYRLRNTQMLSHLWRNIFRMDKIEACDVNNGEVKIYSCLSIGEEAVVAASIIAGEVLSGHGRYRDYAIVTGALDTFRTAVSDAMEKYRIPYFFDNKRSIIRNPFVVAIRNILNVISEDYSYNSVFGYLKTGMTGIELDDIDIFENYILSTGIRGYKKYVSEFKIHKGFSEENIVKINAIRENFMEKTEGLKYLAGAEATVKDITVALYNFIEAEKMEEKLEWYCDCFEKEENHGMVREYSQIYKSVIDLFDKFVTLLGDEKVTLTEYKNMLDAGLEEIKVSIIPPTLDQVVIGDIKRTRLGDVKHIFIIGAVDGIIPFISAGGGIFSENEREYIKKQGFSMSPTVKENNYIQKFYLYMLLTKPEKNLTITYSLNSASDEEQRPSYIIDTIKELFPNIEINRYLPGNKIITEKSGLEYLSDYLRDNKNGIWENADFIQLLAYYYKNKEYFFDIENILGGLSYKNVSDSIGKSVAKVLYGEELKGSVTRLEQYAGCAYRHFLTYGLHLCERQLYKIDAADIGSIYHGVIQGFFEEIKEKEYAWDSLDDDVRKEIVNNNVTKQCEKYITKGMYSSARNAYIATMVKRVSNRVTDILVKHINKGEFEPEYHELSFGMNGKMSEIQYKLDNDAVLRLNGIIDRVDLYRHNDREYVKIIDYKSGINKLDLAEVYDGTQLQLVVYLDEFIKREKNKGIDAAPAAALYFHISDPVIDYKESYEDESKYMHAVLNKYTMNGMINSSEDIINAIETNEKKNSIAVSLKNGETKTNSGSFAADEKAILALMNYVEKKIINMGNEIINGSCDINPVDNNGATPCEWCQYKSVCVFDKKTGNKNRIPETTDENEIWKKISEYSESKEDM